MNPNLVMTILILVVNSSAATILDGFLFLDDMSPEYYINDVSVPYYITAFTFEVVVIGLLKKFTINPVVTGMLILLTAFMLVMHVIEFTMLATGGIDSSFVQTAYPAIIIVLHGLYMFPIILAVLRVFDD